MYICVLLRTDKMLQLFSLRCFNIVAVDIGSPSGQEAFPPLPQAAAAPRQAAPSGLQARPFLNPLAARAPSKGKASKAPVSKVQQLGLLLQDARAYTCFCVMPNAASPAAAITAVMATTVLSCNHCRCGNHSPSCNHCCCGNHSPSCNHCRCGNYCPFLQPLLSWQPQPLLQSLLLWQP